MGDDVTEEPPPGSVVLDRWQMPVYRSVGGSEQWWLPGSPYPRRWDTVSTWGPLRLLWTPEDGAS